jgi:protein involved in polysaccharide export with SLBB domain
MTTFRGFSIGLVFLFLAVHLDGQVTPSAATDSQKPGCASQVKSTYLLGPEDELQISGPELDELSAKTVRVDGEGDIQVPLVGRVHVAGLTVQQAEQELNKRLSTYIRHPQAALDVKDLRSQPASILGAVNAPGVHQVQGHKTLLEMISMAGGIRPDAGYSIRITRQLEWGCIPLPGATLDASGRFTVAQVNLQEIMEAKTPGENIQIFPHDVISVPKAELIYVTGCVKKSGGFILGERHDVGAAGGVHGRGPRSSTRSQACEDFAPSPWRGPAHGTSRRPETHPARQGWGRPDARQRYSVHPRQHGQESCTACHGSSNFHRHGPRDLSPVRIVRRS